MDSSTKPELAEYFANIPSKNIVAADVEDDQIKSRYAHFLLERIYWGHFATKYHHGAT